MSDDAPLARLPASIELTLDEAAAVLEALDLAEANADSAEERAPARAAIRIVTSKLWPELGDLLDGDG